MKIAVLRLNQADKFMLAIVIATPDFGVASINYDLSDLLSKAVEPEQTV